MKQTHFRPRVLVFGDDMRAFLTVVRSLGRRGVEVHAVPFNKDAPALKSRYITKIHHLPLLGQPDNWIDDLKQLVSRYKFDLLIPCCDRSILPLSAHRGDLEDIKMALPNDAVIDGLFDKLKTRKLATKTSTPIAKGRQLLHNDTPDGLIQEFRLPLLIKTRRSYHLHNLEDRGLVHIVRTAVQLDALLETITDSSGYLVEEYFSGTGAGISVLARKGRVVCAFAHRRLKEPDNGGGSSLRTSEELDPDRLECCKNIAALTKLDGIAMFEFRVNKRTGKWVLIEVNARFWGSLPLPVALGVDFPFYLYQQIVHKKTANQADYRNGVSARNLVINTHDVLLGKSWTGLFAFKQFLYDLLNLAASPFLLLSGREISDTFQRDDLRPAFSELIYIPRQVISRLAGRSRQQAVIPS